MIDADNAKPDGPLALIGATIYAAPNDRPIWDGVVLIEGSRIAAVGAREQVRIPPSARLTDCSGLTMTAGFWNSHVHFMERKWIDAAAIPVSELNAQSRDMLSRYGFTAAFDLSSPWENTRSLRDRMNSAETPGPRIYSTGFGLLPPNPGIPPEAIRFMGWMDRPTNSVASPAEAASAAKNLLDTGVDGIKLFMSAPSGAALSGEIVQAAAGEAHRAGKPVFAHPNNASDVLTAVRGGVDIIAHTTPYSGPWNSDVLAEMQTESIALTPTLWIWKWYARHDRRSAQDKVVQTSVEQLRAWHSGGGQVLFGTDLGAVDPDPTEEYKLMTMAGMDFREILTSLTTAPAERFGKSNELGRVAAGFHADLTVLKSDPAENILALTDVQYTLRDGKFIYAG